jgi:hypothetical protein
VTDLPKRNKPGLPPHSFTDNLHPDQFRVPIKEILKMHSADAELQERPGKLVRHAMRRKRREINSDPEYYGAVKNEMATNGQTVPLSIGRAEGHEHLLNGHHRVAIAQELGWSHMNVVRGDTFHSTDHQFDQGHKKTRRESFDFGRG